MARLFDTSTLQPVEIPDDDAPAAVLSGRYGLEGGSRLMLYRPDGGAVTIGAEDAPAAFQRGYKYAPQAELRSAENEERFGAFGKKLLAGSAAVARGLTLGLSDRALRNLGVEAKTLRGLEEGEPLTSAVGETAGIIGTTVATGGATGAGRAAAGSMGLGKGILARAGAKAVEFGVTGALEGGVIGAGHAVSEDALGRADLTAESLIANAGLGALVGGAGGALIGGAGSLAASGARGAAKGISGRMGSGSAKEWLEELANESAVKATGARGAQIRNLGSDKKVQQLGEDLRGYTLKDGRQLLGAVDDAEALLEKLRVAKKEVGEPLAAIRKEVDDFVRTNPSEAWDPGEYLTRVRKEVLDDLTTSPVPSVRKQAKMVYRELDLVQRAHEKGLKIPPSEYVRLRQHLGDIVYPKRPPGGGLPPPAPPHVEPLRKAERILEEWIQGKTDDAVSKFAPERVGEYAKIRRLNESFIKAEALAAKADLDNLGNRAVSPTDHLVGLGGMVSGGIPGAVVGAAANNVLRERGRAFVANAAGKLANLAAIQKASQAVSKRIDKAVSGLVNRPARAASVGAALPAVTSSLLGSSFMPAGATAETDRTKAAKARSSELAQLVADPDRMADRVAVALSGVDEAAPTVSGHAALAAVRAIQHLHAVAPKKTQSTNTLQPLLDEWAPTSKEIAAFERHLRAAVDPLSVLDDLEAGTLTKEAADTFRELYPQLHRLTFEKLNAKLSEAKEKLPYADRVNLSLLLGAPVDDSMAPGFIQRTQAMWAQKPSEGGGSGGQRLAGIDNLDMASGMRPMTQRLEEKR